jgi:hypothetical protein
MACVRVMAPESMDCNSATPALLGRMPSTAKMASAWRDAKDITVGADFGLIDLCNMGFGAVSAMDWGETNSRQSIFRSKHLSIFD